MSIQTGIMSYFKKKLKFPENQNSDCMVYSQKKRKLSLRSSITRNETKQSRIREQNVESIVISSDEDEKKSEDTKELLTINIGNATPEKKSPKPSFYSPSKKKCVTPVKSGFSPRKLVFSNGSDSNSVPHYQDDKTTFLEDIVSAFLSENNGIFHDHETEQLREFLNLGLSREMKLICRLYWRKCRWYREKEMQHISKLDNLTVNLNIPLLVQKGFLIKGSIQNINFDDYENIMSVNELKEICKFFKLKPSNKKKAISDLKLFMKTTTMNHFYRSSHKGNEQRVLEKIYEYAGPCFKLADDWRHILYKLYVFSYCGIDYDIIREKKLELTLLNVKTKREVFPARDLECDSASLIFCTREKFSSYIEAHQLYEGFIEATQPSDRLSLVRNGFKKYSQLDLKLIEDATPQWHLRFTPQYLYIKMMETGIVDVKKCQEYTFALLILDTLLEQHLYRQHKRGSWHNEKSLILHKYVCNYLQSANVLLTALKEDLADECKEVLRTRARKIAGQKNIVLDDDIRCELLSLAEAQVSLENDLPSQHVYKAPIENLRGGKVQYKSWVNDAWTLVDVESYAISWYLEEGFTRGRHWEGRIILTLFYLLFWDIIYSKPANCVGIFLSTLQRVPLDMFCDSFYHNRKEAIDKRLAEIVSTTDCDEIVINLMQATWDSRLEGEISLINSEIPWQDIEEVTRCLGAERLAAICKRLCTNFNYSKSGFPDLTVWHTPTKQIKFVEVKSDSDKLSIKQIQWMNYLLQHGIETEICYVGTRKTKTKLEV